MSKSTAISELFETFTEALIDRYGVEENIEPLKTELIETIDELWRTSRHKQKTLKSTSDTNRISGLESQEREKTIIRFLSDLVSLK